MMPAIGAGAIGRIVLKRSMIQQSGHMVLLSLDRLRRREVQAAKYIVHSVSSHLVAVRSTIRPPADIIDGRPLRRR